MKKIIFIILACFSLGAAAIDTNAVKDANPSGVTVVVTSDSQLTGDTACADIDVTITPPPKGDKTGWIVATALVVAEVILRIVPTKNGRTILWLLSLLHQVLPNRKKKDHERQSGLE